jgi:hypothetical protein
MVAAAAAAAAATTAAAVQRSVGRSLACVTENSAPEGPHPMRA